MKKLSTMLLILLLSIRSNAQSNFIKHACNNDLDQLLHITNPLAISAIKFVQTTPTVIPANSTAPVVVEATISGTPSEVNLELEKNKMILPLNDKGINGDKVANDGIYTVSVPANGNWESLIGYIKLFENGSQISQYNLIVMILTPDMPLVSPKKIDANKQFTPYIFNMIASRNEVQSNPNFRTNVGKEFYKYHKDEFDFLNIITIPGEIGNRFHGSIANNVQGIGLKLFNESNEWGSKGRLKGFNFFPMPANFDPIDNGTNHEIGHQWINYVTKAAHPNSFLYSGVPHWPVSNIATGIMGLSIGSASVGGTFNKRIQTVPNGYNLTVNFDNSKTFNDWELYFMGLIPANEVAIPAIIFKDQTKEPNNGFVPSSDVNVYAINDLIAQLGNRVPDAKTSQKQFNVATIVVSEKLLTVEEISYFNYMAKRAELRKPATTREGLVTYMGNPFMVATRGKGALRSFIGTNYGCSTTPAKPTLSVATPTVCDNKLTNLSAPSGFTGYVWYQDGIPVSEGATFAPTATGNYALSVKNSEGCYSEISNEVNIKVLPSPSVPTLSASSTKNCDGKPISLTAPSGFDKYTWYKDGVVVGEGATYAANATGKYTVSVGNKEGCYSLPSNEINITIATSPPKPTITLTSGGLQSSSATNNQWLLNGVAIPNQTNQTLSSYGSGTYSVTVTQNGCSSTSDIFAITAIDNKSIPTFLELYNAPNPVDKQTYIHFGLPESMRITLKIYSHTGQHITTLANGEYEAGWHRVLFETKNAGAGTYLYRLETPNGSKENKMLLIR